MNRFLSSKSLLAAAVVLGGLAVGSAAHARTDLAVSIGLPFGYVQPAPVYVEPQPVYVQPRPVYVQPRPVYVQPQTVYYGSHRGYDRYDNRGYDRYDNRGHDRRDHRGHDGNAWGDVDRDGIENVFDRDWRYYDARAAHRAAVQKNRADSDGDGVQNRFDRAPRDPARR
jgi:hypothetical protein